MRSAVCIHWDGHFPIDVDVDTLKHLYLPVFSPFALFFLKNLPAKGVIIHTFTSACDLIFSLILVQCSMSDLRWLNFIEFLVQGGVTILCKQCMVATASIDKLVERQNI